MVNIQFLQMKVLGIHPQACRFLRLPHHIHSTFEKSIIERTIQYIKDRTECFDDYFPCRKKNCKLLHVWNWLNLFVGYHNKQLQIVKWTEPREDSVWYRKRPVCSRKYRIPIFYKGLFVLVTDKYYCCFDPTVNRVS
jgi:hypothetical protein